MKTIRPEFEDLLSLAEEKGVRATNISFLRRKFKLWSRNENIIKDYNNKPDDVTRQEMLSRLSEKYHTSEKTIDRIICLPQKN